MDEFDLDHNELTGATISMEFGQGGRIRQLWVAESASPEATQEFQFVCPPIEMGEEVTEDYFPGTILLGARTSPDDPWIVSRNATAIRTVDDDPASNVVGYEYEFSFIDDLGATGRFYEIPGPIPQVTWELQIKNRSRRSVEIGELGFPLALNNVYEGLPRTDEGTKELFHDRIYVHKFIGGAASYIFGQRLNGRPPGLLIYPGEETQWEFYNHVPSSLTTPYRWEGVPVVYVHSRAAIEREGWPEWFNGHTSVVLEPGDSRTYHMRFASTERFQTDPVSSTLIAVGRPAIGLYPSAVAPFEAQLSVEVAGATPTRFVSDVEATLESDADEEGGSCLIKVKSPGPCKLSFEDTAGRVSESNILFTAPIKTLIERRADWIYKNQVVREAGPFQHAILAGNTQKPGPVTDLETFVSSFGIESGLADALFLAEKNTAYPVKRQIEVLDQYLEKFLEHKVANPGDGSVGSLLPNPHAVAVSTGRAQNYALAYCLYDSMSRVADGYGGTARPADEYRRRRNQLWEALLRNCSLEEHNGVPLLSYLTSQQETPEEDAKRDVRRREVASRRYPFNSDSLWSTSGFEEAFWTAKRRSDADGVERYLRYAFAARSLSACWWWYGVDKRWLDVPFGATHPAMEDKGEMCLGPTTPADSLMYLSTLDRDSEYVSQSRLRMAFGGLMGVWALVREDGSASMGFCPDAASKQFGMSWTTGDVGIGLYHYLRGTASIVLASRLEGLQTFGCHFESLDEGPDERFVLKPWDGLGRKILIRHLGLEVTAKNARIKQLAFDAAKRNATLILENPSDKRLGAILEAKGLWGERFEVDGRHTQAQGGILSAQVEVAAKTEQTVQIKVVG
ncbi:MAG TPA: DUF5695 domain-containing protein [Fimbriimonas sp.]|nr:DUF5695 domain-containing protein [Fimbriimonas sp.]